MRNGIVLAAALTLLSATGARADEWCGYATHDNAVIECGYTTAVECETAVGKGGMCFVDPDTRSEYQALHADTPSPSSAEHPAHTVGMTARPAYVFIESKNSPLFLVLRSLSSRKSMASMVPIGLRMRRSTYIFLS